MAQSKALELVMENALDLLEDYTLNTPISRAQHYQNIIKALSDGCVLSQKTVGRLLAICVHDLTEDVKYAANAINVIGLLLNNDMIRQNSFKADYVGSAVSIINLLTKTAYTKLTVLKTAAVDLFLSYPHDTIIEATETNMEQVLEVINSLMKNTELVDKGFKIIKNLIAILPANIKVNFIKKGVYIWFKHVVPKMVQHILQSSQLAMNVLELLTEELQGVDYFDHSTWQDYMMENICRPEKYPADMKKLLLQPGNIMWHRLWIVFVKLLKNQITMNKSKVGSPINSLLPVVEMAFKLDATYRCRAFECWTVLIDNFSTETNESFLNKRIKLLMIPLKSNNAKVELVAMAKFTTWWHLINKFDTKMDKYAEIMLVPFLQYCFGKSTDAKSFVPGMMSNKMKTLCVHAFVDIIGHANCNKQCVTLPKLTNKLVTMKLLVDHWDCWTYSLKTVTKLCHELDLTEQLTCVWKSFNLIIAGLPDNNIRKDLFSEMLAIVSDFLKESQDDDKSTITIFNVLIYSLFEEPKIKTLLKTTDPQGPMYKIISVLFKCKLQYLHDSLQSEQMLDKLKYITRTIIDDTQMTSQLIIYWILDTMPANDNTLVLWTALTESIISFKYDCGSNLFTLITWPLRNIHLYTKGERAAEVWYKLYEYTYPRSHYIADKEIINTLISNPILNNSSAYFVVYILNGFFKCVSNDDKFLMDYERAKPIFMVLMEKLVLLLHFLSTNIDVTLALHTSSAIITSFKMITKLLKTDTDFDITIIKTVLDLTSKLISKETYSEIKEQILKELIEHAKILNKLKSVVKNELTNFMKYYLKRSQETDILLHQNLKSAITIIENDIDIAIINNQGGFCKPDLKLSTKKTKKKEANIVNTVIENGEDYVVVKSNWQFNPRKLTDNQKEKLKRKREDIPALYQDLSQSQDEFKLTTWKTDSQDTTTNSRSNEESTNCDALILKENPRTEGDSNIIDSILSKNNNKDSISDVHDISVDDNLKTVQTLTVSSHSCKDTIAHQMLLKDIVCRNLKVFENNDSLNDATNLNQTASENLPTSPKVANNIDNLIYSAPSKICCDRPSRMKRKPKKLEDSEVFGIRKKRNSLNIEDTLQSAINTCSKSDDNTKTIMTETQNSEEVISIPSHEQTVDNAKETCVTKNDLSESLACNERSQEKKVNEKEFVDNNKMGTADNVAVADNTVSQVIDINSIQPLKVKDDLSTPKSRAIAKVESVTQKPSAKKGSKKSRIENQLAIDMVIDYPILRTQSRKSALLRRISDPTRSSRRNNLIEKLNKSKLETNNTPKNTKKNNKGRDKLKSEKDVSVKNVCETHNTNSVISDDLPESEDIIESSQDSGITTISSKSTKNITNKMPVVQMVTTKISDKDEKSQNDTQKLLEPSVEENMSPVNSFSINIQSKDDTQFSQNQTVGGNATEIDNTEELDTEPIDVQKCQKLCSEVIVIADEQQPIEINTEDTTFLESDSQNTALADTETIDDNVFTDSLAENTATTDTEPINSVTLPHNNSFITNTDQHVTGLNSDNNILISTEPTLNNDEDTNKLNSESQIDEMVIDDVNTSPFKDDAQRKKEFLNNTLEISPIRTMSPITDKRSPSPETSSDFVVIKLTSPVQSNGEPLESPEIFTEDKISPERRDQSPPREEMTLNNNTSPSLSLKKNKPLFRPSGRAAHMLSLCVPDRLQPRVCAENFLDHEESKTSNTMSTPAKRNLRTLYSENINNSDEPEGNKGFLKFKRMLPSSDLSPSVPILKRKLVDIADEVTVSPASKRKRVSFHDPPVSTTVSVQKYIEPLGVRSPQSSSLKRPITRSPNMKSPKRLDKAFKLDNILTRAVESFTEVNSMEDTEMSSLEQTPAIDLVNTSELNDKDPICYDLIDCRDSISNIAGELSSPAMGPLLTKELQGKVETIGDLARLTELEVNRLCIKAPKIKVAKKVLTDYAKKSGYTREGAFIIPDHEPSVIVPKRTYVAVEVQTVKESSIDMLIQTEDIPMAPVASQTDVLSMLHTEVQTNESGMKTTEDVIKSCIIERADYIEKLGEILLNDKMVTEDDANVVLNSVLNKHTSDSGHKLTILKDYLSQKLNTNELILFCSELLKQKAIMNS